MGTSDTNENLQIEQITGLLEAILGEDLLGFYAYGSLIGGGLQKFSDIDLFAVSRRPTSKVEKEKIIISILNISGKYLIDTNKKPIELTIVVKSDVNPWQYPPQFDFQYGDWLRAEFEAGKIEPWPTKLSSNLALVITQLLLSNKVLLGPDPSQLLPAVPYKDFFNATTSEIESLMRDLDWDTRNVLLTLARIWCTLKTDAIQSKSDAASFAIGNLSEEYTSVLHNAKSILLGEGEENWSGLENQIKSCAEFMIKQIKQQMEIIKSSNYSNRTIKLG